MPPGQRRPGRTARRAGRAPHGGSRPAARPGHRRRRRAGAHRRSRRPRRRRWPPARPACHRRLEGGPVLAVAFEVVEEVLAVDALEGRAPAEHGVEQATRRSVVHLAPHDRRALQPVQGTPRRASRQSARRRSRPARPPPRGPAAHGSSCVGSTPTASATSAPLLGPSASTPAMPELGRDVQQLRRDEAVQEPQELPGRCRLGRRGSAAGRRRLSVHRDLPLSRTHRPRHATPPWTTACTSGTPGR